jgi:hypothetical protein
MNNRFGETVKKWLPLGFLAIVLCGLVYLAVQQSLRLSANDPQIQMAEDAAVSINNGTEPLLLVPQGSVDISTSLSPYLIIFNASGTPIAGNGLLEGALPSLPPGVFSYTRASGEDRFTWQPRAGVRSAVILVHTNDPNAEFVLAGRSLREVESREDQLMVNVGIALITALIGTFLLKLLLSST